MHRSIGEDDVGIVGITVRIHHQPHLPVGPGRNRLIEKLRRRGAALRDEIDALRRWECNRHRVAAVASQLNSCELHDHMRRTIRRRCIRDRQSHERHYRRGA
jgi:hypothetical protein